MAVISRKRRVNLNEKQRKSFKNVTKKVIQLLKPLKYPNMPNR